MASKALPTSKPQAMKEHKPIAHVGNKFVVVGLNTGKTLGTHPTLAQAQAQLRAIEQSMHGKK